jgi:hypothetical protein
MFSIWHAWDPPGPRRWCLPRYGEDDDETLFEFQAARMRNYMRKRVLEDNYKPRHYTGDRCPLRKMTPKYNAASGITYSKYQ